jgi:hypothetical protein
MKLWLSTGMLLAIGLMTACAAMSDKAPAEDRKIPITMYYSSTQCGMQALGVTADWIERPEDLESLLCQRGGTKEYPASRMRWDPSKEGVLRIQMGRQPTGGYALELAAPTAQVIKKTAFIRLNLRKPSPGMFVTQAFTSPCLLLKVPKQGINMIHVIDQQGKVRAKIPVP